MLVDMVVDVDVDAAALCNVGNVVNTFSSHLEL